MGDGIVSDISEKTWRVIKRLINLSGMFSSQTSESGDTETRIRLINQLEESGDSASLPILLELLFDRNASVRVAAESAVVNILKCARPKDFPLIDSRLRAGWFGSNLWRTRLSQHNLARSAAATRIPVEFLSLATTHRDGYVRQEGIRLLAKAASDGSEIPFLLLRINDWVPEVRDEALQAVRARLQNDQAYLFIRNYWLVNWLAASERPRSTSIPSEIDGFLCQVCHIDLLFAEMKCDISYVRRSCFALLVQADKVSVEQIIDRAVQSFDEQIRLKAMLLAHARLRGDRLKQVLCDRLRDPYGPIRRRALEEFDSHFSGESRPVLIESLLDRHRIVRATARAILKSKDPNFGFSRYYRDALASEHGVRRTAAISGLGETGEQKDSERIIPYLNASLPRDRKAALLSLYGLDREGAIPVLLDAITDAHAGVSRVAMNILCQDGLDSHIDQLIETVQVVQSEHGISNALTSIVRAHEWKSLAIVLAFCRHPAKSIADHAMVLMRGWLRRPYMARGTRADIKRVAAEIDRVGHQLPSARLKDLELLIRLGLANH